MPSNEMTVISKLRSAGKLDVVQTRNATERDPSHPPSYCLTSFSLSSGWLCILVPSSSFPHASLACVLIVSAPPTPLHLAPFANSHQPTNDEHRPLLPIYHQSALLLSCRFVINHYLYLYSLCIELSAVSSAWPPPSLLLRR